MQQNTVAPWALALSLVSLGLALSLVGTLFALPVALVSLILGVMAVVRSRRIPGPLARTGFSVTAIICSLIALVISALLWAVVLFYLGMTELPECWGSDPVARQECIDAIRGTP